MLCWVQQIDFGEIAAAAVVAEVSWTRIEGLPVCLRRKPRSVLTKTGACVCDEFPNTARPLIFSPTHGEEDCKATNNIPKKSKRSPFSTEGVSTCLSSLSVP